MKKKPVTPPATEHNQAFIDGQNLYLVSGDGDYCRVVKYLRDQGRLGKVLLPNRENASGLYNTIGDEYRTFLDTPEVKKKISRESAKSRGGQHLSSKKRESLR